MRKIDALKRSAIESAKFRRHRMSLFRWIKPGCSAIAYCRKCSASVVVNLHPNLNEIDICGSAVAVNCTAKEGKQE